MARENNFNWFGLLGILAIICLPIFILRDAIHDVLVGKD